MFGAAYLRDGPGLEAYRTRQAAGPLSFNLLDWEADQLSRRLDGLVRDLLGGRSPANADDVQTVSTYFQTAPGVRASLREGAEAAIQRLVADAWQSEELARPLPFVSSRTTLFPPVSFVFTQTPQLLIVSPRDRIEVRQYVLLRTRPDPGNVALLEDGVARRGVSTLVAPTGGLASYPAMVLETVSAELTLSAVAHEWVHAYFFFQPLGRGYWSDQDMRTINETAAELAGA